MFDAMETLVRLLNLPYRSIDSVVRTSDGFYIGHVRGDIGYNAFYGKPASPHPGPGRMHMLDVWRGLTPEEQSAVIAVAANPPDGTPIPLTKEFGLE